jgi:hypothetical protein
MDIYLTQNIQYAEYLRNETISGIYTRMSNYATKVCISHELTEEQ